MPLPATVVISPVAALTLRMTLSKSSTIYKLPAESSATPVGFLNPESATGQPSPMESVCPAQPAPPPAKVVINELTTWTCACVAAAISRTARIKPTNLNREFFIRETSLFLKNPSLQLAAGSRPCILRSRG